MKKHFVQGVALLMLSATSVSMNAAEQGLVPPYFKDLYGADALSDMTVIDVNQDDKTWKENKSGWVNYSYHRTNPGDDWLITPALHLEAGKAYDLKVIIGSYNSYNEEKFEIYLGTAPTVEGMTTEIVAPTATKNCYKDDPEVKGVVNITTTGEYYIGVHCISEPNRMSLYCKSISLEMGYSPMAPGNLEDVTVTANPYGDYLVNVAFTAPAVNYVGDSITDNVTVKLQRDGNDVKTWEVAPGAKVEYTDVLQHIGFYNYRLTPYSAAGYEGRSVVIDKLFVGPNAASVPQNVKVTEPGEPGVVTVKWDPVTTDIKGTVLDPKDVTYNLYSPSLNGLETSYLEPFAECEKTRTELKDASKQKFVRYCVAAFNRGMKGDVSAMTPPIAIGKSYTLPVLFSATNSDLVYASASDSGIEWTVTSSVSGVESQDGDGAFYMAMSGSDSYGKTSDFYTGKIDLTDAEFPQLEFYTYSFGSTDRNTVTVFVMCDGQMKQIGQIQNTYADDNVWACNRYSLTDYKGKTIQVIFRAKYLGVNCVVLDNISVKEAIKYDIKAEGISAPSFVTAGQEYEVTVSLINNGVVSAENAKLNFYRNDKLVTAKELPAIEPGKGVKVVFHDVQTLYDCEAVKYDADVEFAIDQVPGNNAVATVLVTREKNDFDVIEGLSGIRTTAGNEITWKAVDMSAVRPAPILETFESCESFADTAPGWTLLDRDGKGIGYMIETSKGYQIPNHPSLEPAGFFVWDHAKSRFSAPCNAYSGTKFLASVFNADYSAVNDWAISPLLSGEEQQISFYAQSYDDNGGNHPELLQIYYATEDTTDPEKFVLLTTFGNNGTYSVPCVRENNMSAYTAVRATLPAGAKRFAFVSTAADAWMLMIDDVCFTPDASISALKFMGYNIYRDGVKLNSEPLTEARYVDADNSAEHEYRVTAVYEQGESELSAPLVISTTGVQQIDSEAQVSVMVEGRTLTVKGADGLSVVIVTPDGRVICSTVGDVRMDLSANIYIVKVGTKVTKIVVR